MPSPSTAPGREGDEVVALLGAVLAGDAIPDVADRVGVAATAAAAAATPTGAAGHRVVVAGRSGAGRVYGRDIALPRRAVLALDRVATAGPGPEARLGAAVWADAARAPWDDVVADLREAGLGPPLLVALAEGAVPLGVLAAFPPTVPSDRPLPSPARAAADLGLAPWAAVASVALAREADRARLRLSAVEDGVTGLPTRSLVRARLHEALHRTGRTVALVEAALDRLDRIEDGLGDGEALLRVAAQRMRAVVRPGDVVGHLRTNALAVICEGAGPDEAAEIAERVRLALVEPIRAGGRDLAPTPGVGVVVANEADTVNSLVHKADIAAREAAGRGGSEVVRYRPGAYEEALARVDIEDELRRALADDALHLLYQPQVSLRTGRLVGVEALVRWEHPTRGAVGPDEFIPVAEETGLVVALGSWAVDTALADIAAGLPVPVSVNVSARQLDEPSFLAEVTASLDHHRVDPARLRLEITESALARDKERSAALLQRLRRLGLRVSIDDFGTGYASLEQLRQTEVADSLKIDRTFVAGIIDDPRDRAIVAAAVTLGRSLEFTVVAEGVEDPAQADLLRDMGCDVAQGYWFGEAVPADKLAEARFPPAG